MCGWGSVAYHVLVTVTLTSDLVFRIFLSRAIYLILFEIGIPKSGVWMDLGITECPVPSLGHCDLDL